MGLVLLIKKGITFMKIGIIGTGWIAESFVEGAIDSGLWDVYAVYSRKRESGLAFANKYKINNVYTTLDDLASSGIDAVYIASPNSLHVEQSIFFLNHHIHVICEKPASAHPEDIRSIAELCVKNNVIFMEAIMYMHLPMRAELKESLSKIGHISFVKFDFCQRSSKYDAFLSGSLPNVFNPAMEAGALMDLGIYCIYPALDLFGIPDKYSIDVKMLSSGVDGSGIISLIYNDKIVSIPYSKVGQAIQNSEIQGDKGTISISSISKLENIVIYYNEGNTEKVSGVIPKYKLMEYEAVDFYKFINEPEKYKLQYRECLNKTFQISKFLEKLRKNAHIFFPNDIRSK
jgi:predicted dehydrogenase